MLFVVPAQAMVTTHKDRCWAWTKFGYLARGDGATRVVIVEFHGDATTKSERDGRMSFVTSAREINTPFQFDAMPEAIVDAQFRDERNRRVVSIDLSGELDEAIDHG